MEITRDEIDELDHLLDSVLLPEGVSLAYNGDPLDCRRPIKVFETALPTQIADEEGVMRPTSRKTAVRIDEPHDGELPDITNSAFRLSKPIFAGTSVLGKPSR